MMRSRSLFALVAAAAFVLTACGSSSTGQSGAAPSDIASSSSGTAALSVATSSLGKIVVDGTGMAVYVYDEDTQGATASACTGSCLGLWPPVIVTGTPQAPGVTGTLGTIDAPNGGKQLTIDGWPLYTYAGDSAPGEVTGQGSGGIWWAVSPDGTKITGQAPAADSSSAGGYGNY